MIHNKTPHDVVIMQDGKEIKRLRKQINAVRLRADTVQVGIVDDVPLTKTTFKEAQGLPPYKEGVYYIVSNLVKTGLPYRKDLLVPAEVVRDEKGRILGCKSLGM